MLPAVVSFISTIASYRLCHIVAPPALSVFTLFTQVVRLQNVLLRIDFSYKKTTTAHCSVPMLKRPSDEEVPSH